MVAKLELGAFFLAEIPALGNNRYCGGTVLAGAVVSADHLGTATPSCGRESRTRQIIHGILAVPDSVLRFTQVGVCSGLHCLWPAGACHLVAVSTCKQTGEAKTPTVRVEENGFDFPSTSILLAILGARLVGEPCD